jgi:hypothetical protein
MHANLPTWRSRHQLERMVEGRSDKCTLFQFDYILSTEEVLLWLVALSFPPNDCALSLSRAALLWLGHLTNQPGP